MRCWRPSTRSLLLALLGVVGLAIFAAQAGVFTAGAPVHISLTKPLIGCRAGGGAPVPTVSVCQGGELDRASDPWVSFGPDGGVHSMSLVTDAVAGVGAS